MTEVQHEYNGAYSGDHLSRVAFPLGGIGAGMVCIEGTGAISHVSLRGQPNVFFEPQMFAALCVKGETNVAKVLEGAVPGWKVFGMPGSGNGNHGGKSLGLPRCDAAAFETHFPFGSVALFENTLPLRVEITGWSPFTPPDPDPSSLPVAGLEYAFANRSDHAVEAVFSFHAGNFMATGAGGQEVRAAQNGFTLYQPPTDERPCEEGAFCVAVDDDTAKVDCAWFRGGWFDSQTLIWKSIEEGAVIENAPVTEGDPSPGGSVYVPFRVAPGATKTIRVRLCWYAPETDIRIGKSPDDDAATTCSEGSCCGGDAPKDLPKHRPWYTSKLPDIDAVNTHWRDHYDTLRSESQLFADTFYDTTLPPEVIEAVAANMTILKSPTVLRQTDGRIWAWEGCCDGAGCCHGSCTHVWNYAQALCHLFPSLERTLRETEFNECQDERGHQAFRANLPISECVEHAFHSAADGQLGGIMKVYRDWRISGDTDWLRDFWPKVRKGLDYCIETWDPRHVGLVEEPHHNTYDIEFWGPDGMCTSFYVGALRAACLMAEGLGEEPPALYAELYEAGRRRMETDLYDGEYFIQKIQWKGLQADDPTTVATLGLTNYSPEAREILEREGPKYQYGSGCISDGILGAWMARTSGIGETLDPEKETSHLRAIHKHNLRKDLRNHPNPQRPTFAIGREGGLLLCTWPKGGDLTLPFVYSNEVWTGIEYQVASHLMMMGCVEEGLEIVRAARDRYDGRVRNPFNEYECGHWYARAMSSYGLLQGLTGARYDAVTQTVHLAPNIKGDFHSFLSTATGYGTVGIKDGQPFLNVASGEIVCKGFVTDMSR